MPVRWTGSVFLSLVDQRRVESDTGELKVDVESLLEEIFGSSQGSPPHPEQPGEFESDDPTESDSTISGLEDSDSASYGSACDSDSDWDGESDLSQPIVISSDEESESPDDWDMDSNLSQPIVISDSDEESGMNSEIFSETDYGFEGVLSAESDSNSSWSYSDPEWQPTENGQSMDLD